MRKWGRVRWGFYRWNSRRWGIEGSTVSTLGDNTIIGDNTVLEG